MQPNFGFRYRKFNRHRKQLAGRNRHHFILPRSRGGDESRQNLLVMHIERHTAWHKLFGTMTAEEAVELLQRAIRAKKHQS